MVRGRPTFGHWNISDSRWTSVRTIFAVAVLAQAAQGWCIFLTSRGRLVQCRHLLAATNYWAEFHDLCWDSVKVLLEQQEYIVSCWRQILRNRAMNDAFLADVVPGRVKHRLGISRFDLDEQLREKSLLTWAKNLAHLLKLKAAEYRNSSMAKPSSPVVGRAAEPQSASRKLESELEPEPEPDLEEVVEDTAFNALLRQLDVLEYASVLAGEDIRSEADLADLSMDELEQMGVKLGSRKRIRKWASSYV